MLTLSNISKTFYKGEANELCVLNDISFEIHGGDFAILLGNNGSGKSTLLKVISGDIIPDKGEIFMDGYNITKFPAYKRSKNISYVQQYRDFNLVPNLTVKELFSLVQSQKKSILSNITQKKYIDRINYLLTSFNRGLHNRLEEQVASLSGGEHQMITLLIAAEIIKHNNNKNSLLLLDEHIAHLDPNSARVVMDFTSSLITEYGLTTLMVTHDISIAQRFGDRILVINKNNIAFDKRYGYCENKDLDMILEILSV
jgi:putative ABC transport system ATP-binding protein